MLLLVGTGIGQRMEPDAQARAAPGAGRLVQGSSVIWMSAFAVPGMSVTTADPLAPS